MIRTDRNSLRSVRKLICYGYDTKHDILFGTSEFFKNDQSTAFRLLPLLEKKSSSTSDNKKKPEKITEITTTNIERIRERRKDPRRSVVFYPHTDTPISTYTSRPPAFGRCEEKHLSPP